MSTYTVTAERTAKWWVLQADEAPGAISQVARLDQADQIKEAIAFVTGEPEDEIEIELRPALPDAAEDAIRKAHKYRHISAGANAWAAYENRLAAHELAASGLSVRDIGFVLGVSYQRAQQLTTAELEPPTVKADFSLA